MGEAKGPLLPDLPEELRSPWLERYFLQSAAARPPLRLGLMLDEESCPAILAVSLEQAARAGYCEIALVIEHDAGDIEATDETVTGPRWLRLLRRYALDPEARRLLGWSVYERWSQKRRPDLAALFAPVSLAPLLAGVPRLRVRPWRRRFVHRFPEEDVERVRAADLDVILRYGFNILKGPILDAARHGVWSYHHGDNEFYRGGPPYFWELREGACTSGAILQRLTEELDGGQLLGKSIQATEKSFDLGPNLSAGYASGAGLLMEALHHLHQSGEPPLIGESRPYRGQRKIYRRPSNLEVVTYAWQQGIAAVARRLKPKESYHWRIGVKAAGKDDPLPESVDGYRWLEAPPGRYWADPYVLQHAGQAYLFFEDAPAEGGAAHIAVAKLDESLRPGPTEAVLRRPFHLSNPFVFEDRGQMYMLPEGGQSGRVQLYRASDFPHRWEEDAVLADAPGRDSVLWKGEDAYYLFFTLREPRWSGPQLWLMQAPNLQGPWTPHPASPISRDVRFARAAGRPFLWRGKLLRPAQDGSERYGYALHFMEIERLDRKVYRERPMHSVYPEPQRPPVAEESVAGLHAFHRQDGLEAIDLQTLRR